MSAADAEDPTIRYDRQVRLWGPRAQRNLMTANVCLLNASASGTETLKNLVLPGIHAFTIIDGKKVSDVDVGNNFFVLPNSQGQSRAELTCKLLQELNPLVKGHFIEQDVHALAASEDKSILDTFACVVATELNQTEIRALGKYLAEKKIPFFVIRTNGQLAWLRSVAPEMYLLDTKPDNAHPDLRLNDPWPELKAYLEKHHHENVEQLFEEAKTNESIKLDLELETVYAHVPFVGILHREWTKAIAANDGKPPARGPFMRAVRAIDMTLDNFREAGAKVLLLWAVAKVPHNVASILEEEAAKNVDANCSLFWVCCNALQKFIDQNDGYLPLNGGLPDMTTMTEYYITLQNIYTEKAAKDKIAMLSLVNETLASLGREAIPDDHEEFNLFVKNARNISICRTGYLEDEYTPTPERGESLSMLLMEPQVPVAWYLAMRAAEQFEIAHGRVPGSDDAKFREDCMELRAQCDSLLAAYGMETSSVSNEQVQEVVRFGGDEIHTLAALVGGATAQEVIKVVGGPVFVPLNNTWVYSGVECAATQFHA